MTRRVNLPETKARAVVAHSKGVAAALGHRDGRRELRIGEADARRERPQIGERHVARRRRWTRRGRHGEPAPTGRKGREPERPHPPNAVVMTPRVLHRWPPRLPPPPR